RRRDLVAIDGIGEETADCILLFAGEHPSFVIDAYTRRAFTRLGLFPRRGAEWWLKQPYRVVQDFLQGRVLADLSLYDKFTFAPGVRGEGALRRVWQARRVDRGRHHCGGGEPGCRRRGAGGGRASPPCARHCLPDACEACPLLDTCKTGR